MLVLWGISKVGAVVYTYTEAGNDMNLLTDCAHSLLEKRADVEYIVVVRKQLEVHELSGPSVIFGVNFVWFCTRTEAIENKH